MKIFIGCSMNDKIGESFKQTSEKLLREILVDNDLVFGACDSGIMGIAYNIAIANNKSVTGVCPDKYKDDFKNLNCNHEFTTKDIATRVNTFVEESDVLLFLPGGYGTLCEFFCMVEQKRAGEFDKPIILYNDSESLYYSTLTGFFSEMKEFGFSTEKEEAYFKVMSTPKEVVKFLKDYEEKKLSKLSSGNHPEIAMWQKALRKNK